MRRIASFKRWQLPTLVARPGAVDIGRDISGVGRSEGPSAHGGFRSWMSPGLGSDTKVSFEQLALPLAGLDPVTEPTRIPRTRRIFVNRNLKMSGIDWVGFDMDYTLAIYNQAERTASSVNATVEKLLARGYQRACSGP